MGQNAAHLRSLAAQMAADGPEGMKCYYCKVPTAATIEHVQPRAGGGRSLLNNLVLACPYCNTHKSTRDVEEFYASGDWKLVHPPLPATVQELLATKFGWQGETQLKTGSPHARLEISDKWVLLLIRPGRKYPWTKINLGAPDNPRVVAGSYDFLRRHYTPKTPKDPHPMMSKLWGDRPRLEDI